MYRDFTKFVKQHFAETDNLIGVEVGVWKGDNALSIAEYLKPKLLILVDAWNETVEAGNAQHMNEINQSDYDESQEGHLLHTYRNFANATNVVIIRGLSTLVAELLIGNFDFVYIDAGHCYESIKNDIKFWSPLVREGGVLGGHDYNMDGIETAVREAFKDTSNKISIGWKEGDIKSDADGRVYYQGIDWWVIK